MSSASASATTATRTEHILVLYGSQTGNCEEHATSFCESLPEQLSTSTITVTASHMQLDDFLELENAKWPRLVVIFVSSYGVGQAPLGCYRFRDLCDHWKESETTNVLNGVHYALCGLGDSSYPTFFQNPTVLDTALSQVGATRVGSLGKADANIVSGKDAQPLVVQRWKNDIWKELAKVVAQEPLSEQVLAEMQRKTVAVCREINPEFGQAPIGNATGNNAKKSSANSWMIVLAIMVAIVAMGAYRYMAMQHPS